MSVPQATSNPPSSPPPTAEPTMLERLKELWESHPRTQRELVIFGLMFAIGLFGVPFLIWYVGNRMLGPYTHGQNTHAGPFALLLDYFTGLMHGSAVFWAVALGPFVMLLLSRIIVLLIRARPPRGDG
ncbi:MAG TPA: hypothetical protein VEH54_02475 [Steroidobacteraceae bacterium]|nr:hypothetical protein [Steroidobacteraceae bacterium]